MSQDLGVNGKIYKILDIYFGYTNEHRKRIENEYDSQFKNYREIDQDEKNKICK